MTDGPKHLLDVLAPVDPALLLQIKQQPVDEVFTLEERVEFARNMVSCSVARGECACCAESAQKQIFKIPENISLL